MALSRLSGSSANNASGNCIGLQSSVNRNDARLLLDQCYDDEQRLVTIRELSQRGVAELGSYIDVIVAVLNLEPDAETKAAICKALRASGPLGTQFSLDIHYLLDDPDAKVRCEVCLALGEMSDKAAGSLHAMAGLLNDKSDNVRYGACIALGRLEATELVEEVAALLDDGSLEVQGAACWSLAKFGRIGHIYVPEVTRRIREPRCRLQVLRSLALMGAVAGACCADVVDCLVDENIEVRMAAAAAIRNMAEQCRDDDVAMDKLVSYLRGADGRWRCSAAIAVGNLGEFAVEIEELRSMLDDCSEDFAADALTVGGCRAPIPPEWRIVRCAAASALSHLPSGFVAGFAVDIARLLEDSHSDVRGVACDCLGRMGALARHTHDKLVALLIDQRPYVRAKAVLACGAVYEPDSLTKIAEMADDKHSSVRVAALQALGRLGDDADAHAIVAYQLLADTLSEVRAAACETLAEFGSRGRCFASGIAQRLDDHAEAPMVRVAAVKALGTMGPRGRAHEQLLSECLQDENLEVARFAEKALGKLGCGFANRPQIADQFIHDVGEVGV